MFQYRTYTAHGFTEHGVDILITDDVFAGAAPGSVVSNHADGGVVDAEFARQHGFRHAGHATMVAPSRSKPVDFGSGFQTRPCTAHKLRHPRKYRRPAQWRSCTKLATNLHKVRKIDMVDETFAHYIKIGAFAPPCYR